MNLNVELLEKVKKHILEEPRRLDMDIWYKDDLNGVENAPPCGTVACIAGWTCVLEGKTNKR